MANVADLLLSAEGHLDEGNIKEGLEEAKKVLELAESSKDLALIANATRIVVEAHKLEAEKSQAKPEEAERLATEALDRFRKLGREKEEAVMLLSLAEVNGETRWSKRRTKAERSANKALKAFKKLGETALEAAALNQLAAISRKEQDLEGALQTSTEAAERALLSGDKRMEALCLHGLALGKAMSFEFEEALESEESALALVKSLGVKRLEAAALSNMSQWNLSLGNVQKALSQAQQALATKPGNQETLAHVLALTHSGKFPEAVKAAKDGVGRAKTGGDKRAEVVALRVLARAYLADGDSEQATKAYEDALAVIRELGDRMQEFQMLHAMAVVYTDQRLLRKAEHPLREAVSIAETPGEKGMTLRSLAELRVDMEDYGEALETAKEAQEAFQEDGDKSGEASALMLMSTASNMSGGPDKAVALTRLAHELVFVAGDFQREAIVLQMLAQLYMAQGNHTDALDSLSKAIEAYDQLRDYQGAAQTLTMIGELQCDANSLTEAEQTATQAQEFFAAVADDEGEASANLLLARIRNKLYETTRMEQFLLAMRMASSQAVLKSAKTPNVALQAAATFSHAQAMMLGNATAPDEALKLGKRAQGLFKDCGDVRGEAHATIVYSAMLLQQGENDKARDLLEKALSLARSAEDADAERHAQEALDAIEAAKYGAAPVARGRPGRGGDAPGAAAGGAEAGQSVAVAGGPKAMTLDPSVVRAKLMELTRNAIGTGDDVEADSALMDAGMDSLSATDFTGQVAREFRLGASPSLVFDFPTVREIVNHIMEETSG